ncbi:MAG: DUF11 domain-containing protein [Planctomycetes bacterium]|nr:DUF11 domain-containing protein [Planctomycetota bacterium]
MRGICTFAIAMTIAWVVAVAAPGSAYGSDFAAAMAGANYKQVKDTVYAWAGFPGPCTTPSQAQVLLEKQAPADVMVGEPFSYEIQVSNRTNSDIVSVMLDDSLPANFAVDSITPEPARDSEGRLYWDLGSIPAKGGKKVTITGRALAVGCLVTVSSAKICFDMPLPLAIRVSQCNIELRKTLPETADLCDPIPMCLTVVNTGSAPATNVMITDDLPAGLLTADGKSSIRIKAGAIAPGESKVFNIELKATARGEFVNTACATADRDCSSQASSRIRIVAPELRLEASGPAEAYICTQVPYSIRVSNTGDSPARDVVLVDSIAGPMVVQGASHGAKYAARNGARAGSRTAGNRVAWNLGTINPGESCEISVVGSSTVEGQAQSTFQVNARCAEAKQASHCVNLVGVPGVLTSVQDDCDPVMVNGQVTYTVTATNTGSRDATNLRYTIRLDEGMEYVGGTGVTAIEAIDNRTLAFAPVPVLQKGGQSVAWQITIRATSPGDKRFTAELMTNEFSNAPVAKSESTFFYQANMTVVVAQ